MIAAAALCIQVTPQPSRLKIFPAVTGRLPDIHAPEMGSVGIRIADTIEDAQASVIVQSLQPRKCRMQTCLICDQRRMCLIDAQPGPRPVINIIAYRDHRIESIIASAEL